MRKYEIENSHLKMAFKNGSTPSKYQDNLVYATIMGSMAYNCHHKQGEATAKKSDFDVYGVYMCEKEDQFPQQFGFVYGFDTVKEFEVYQKHHISSSDNNAEYDLNIYPFPRYVKLCAENNPNMLDSLFTQDNLHLHNSEVSNILIANRGLFLSKQAKAKLMGYAHGQFNQLEKQAKSNSEKRQEDIKFYGYDLKKAYHVIRLALQAQQILIEHDLDITRNAEILKDIRAGNWSLQQLRDYYNELKSILEHSYNSSTLRVKPDELEIKGVVNKCFEAHYGSLSKAEFAMPDQFNLLKNELKNILLKF